MLAPSSYPGKNCAKGPFIDTLQTLHEKVVMLFERTAPTLVALPASEKLSIAAQKLPWIFTGQNSLDAIELNLLVLTSSLNLKLSFYCYIFYIDVADGQCMREWLQMAGTQTTSLNVLEEKTRNYHLSESKIRQEHKAILKLLLPANVVEKMKVCAGENRPISHTSKSH